MRHPATVAAVAIGAAWAGLTAPTNLTLPWSELGRPGPAAWEAAAWAAALIGLAAVPTGGRVPGWPGRIARATLLLAATLALAWTLTRSTKWTLNVVAPATEGAVTAPFLGAPATRVVWTRRLAEGPAIRLSAELLQNEAALAGLAGGIHQAEAAAAAASGQRNGVVVAAQDGVRRGLWWLHRGVTTLTVYGRISLLVTLPLALLLTVAWRVPTPLRWLVRLPVWAVPSANALSVLVTTVGLLPDDLGLRGKAALIAAAQLAVVAWADGAGRVPR